MWVGNLRTFGRFEKEVGARSYCRIINDGERKPWIRHSDIDSAINSSELAQPKGERNVEWEIAATTCHHVSMVVWNSCETYFYYCPAVAGAAIGSWALRREVAATSCHLEYGGRCEGKACSHVSIYSDRYVSGVCSRDCGSIERELWWRKLGWADFPQPPYWWGN